MDAAPSPVFAPFHLCPLRNPGTGAHCHPVGSPSPSWKASGGPASRPAACSGHRPSQGPHVSPSLLPARPLLWARRAAPGRGVASAGWPLPPARRADAAWASQHPGRAPSQARRPPAPPPPSQKDRTTEKPPPAKLCNCPSNRQKKTLLPTQMWGSFQDPSSGEFLGGTGRKPPTFHADRRLQTVCCSCNEILIFPPFFLSLAPLFFFFPLVCVRAGSWSSQAEPAHFLYCIIPQAVCSLCKQAFPPRAARPGRGCAPGLAAEARAFSAARPRSPRTAPAPRPPRSPLPARPPQGRSLRTLSDSERPQPLPTAGGGQPGQKPGKLPPTRPGIPPTPRRSLRWGLPWPLQRGPAWPSWPGHGRPKWGGRWTCCFLLAGVKVLCGTGGLREWGSGFGSSGKGTLL